MAAVDNTVQSVTMGQAVLAGGTATVSNQLISANSRIFLTRRGVNLSTALGELAVTTLTPGAGTGSFVIGARQPGTPGSLEANDLSTVDYLIVG